LFKSFDRATRNSSRDKGEYRNLFRRLARARQKADQPRAKTHSPITGSKIGDNTRAPRAIKKSAA